MPYATANKDYLQALRQGDRRKALQVLRDLQQQGLPLRAIYLSVVAPAMTAIGDLWQSSQLSVAEEHLATAITQSVIAALYDQTFAGAGTRHGGTLIGACTENEWHEIGLRMFCDLAELDGWEALHLGASVPSESLLALVRQRHPDVVALSVATPPNIPGLRQTIQQLRQVAGAESLKILIGGHALKEDPVLVRRLGADYAAADAGDAIDWLRKHGREHP